MVHKETSEDDDEGDPSFTYLDQENSQLKSNETIVLDRDDNKAFLV